MKIDMKKDVMHELEQDQWLNGVVQTIQEEAYPKSIDIVDSVMDSVEVLSFPVDRWSSARKWAISVAACMFLAVSFNIVRLYTRSFNERQINDMFAEVYDYNYMVSETSADLIGMDFLYE